MEYKFKSKKELKTLSSYELRAELSKATFAYINEAITGNQLFSYQMGINEVRDELNIPHIKPSVRVEA